MATRGNGSRDKLTQFPGLMWEFWKSRAVLQRTFTSRERLRLQCIVKSKFILQTTISTLAEHCGKSCSHTRTNWRKRAKTPVPSTHKAFLLGVENTGTVLKTVDPEGAQ